MCRFLLLNNKHGTLRQNCSVEDTYYIFQKTSLQEEVNMSAFSLLNDSWVDCLKWSLDWKLYGQKGFSQRIEHYLQLAQ